jgi:hypothetical protein
MDRVEKERRLRSIKNRIRKYNPEETLKICADLLSQIENGRTQSRNKRNRIGSASLKIDKLDTYEYAHFSLKDPRAENS